MAQRMTLTNGLLGALVVALAGLNVYQYAAAPQASDASRPDETPRKDAAPPRPLKPPPATPIVEPPPPLETPPPLTEEQERLVEEFHKLSYDRQFGYWFRPVQGGLPHTMAVSGYGTPSRWLGVVAAQNPFDTWIHQEIIAEIKPDVIVETGTYFGGGALIWASILEQVNPGGKVITIDIDDKTEFARGYPAWKERVVFLKGSSTDAAIVAEVRKQAEGKRVLVILDSAHHKSHVLGELDAYAPLVGEGSYVIVHDTNFGGHPVLPDFGEGPREAAQEFLASHPEFQVDRSRERFLFTIHPGGYLRHVGKPAAASPGDK